MNFLTMMLPGFPQPCIFDFWLWPRLSSFVSRADQCEDLVDLVFVVDNSGSICDNYINANKINCSEGCECPTWQTIKRFQESTVWLFALPPLLSCAHFRVFSCFIFVVLWSTSSARRGWAKPPPTSQSSNTETPPRFRLLWTRKRRHAVVFCQWSQFQLQWFKVYIERGCHWSHQWTPVSPLSTHEHAGSTASHASGGLRSRWHRA